MNFNGLIVYASAVGVPLGLIKYVSIWEKDGKWDEIRLIVGQLNTLLLILGIILLVVNVLFSKNISIFLFGNESYYLLITLISFSIPFSLFTPTFEAILKGLKKFGDYVKISILISVFSLLITLVLVYFYQIEGVVVSLIISAFLVAGVYSIYLQKRNLLRFSQIFSFDFCYSQNFRIIIKLGLASLLVGFAEQLSQLIVRSDIIKILGVDANGLYQSVYAISLNYFSILFMSLGIYLLPVLSEMKEKSLINSEINYTLKLAFTIIVPIILIVYVFRVYIVLFLYSEEFLPSTDILFVNFLGDYFKAFSWIIGAWLIPLSRVKLWVTTSFVYYFNFVILFLILLNYFELGLKSVVISYFVSYVIHAIINLYYIISINDFRFTKFNSLLIPLSFGFILTLMVVSNYDLMLGYILIIPTLILWIKISVSKEEYVKAFKILKGFISK